MIIDWDEEKNRLLKETRGVSFEQVLEAIKNNAFWGPEDNPARPDQKIITVMINNYPCIVPYVEMEGGGWFLKTIYQSRKMKRRLENEF